MYALGIKAAGVGIPDPGVVQESNCTFLAFRYSRTPHLTEVQPCDPDVNFPNILSVVSFTNN